MPKGMIWSFAAGTAVALALTLIVGINWLKILLLLLTLVLAVMTVWTILMYRAFSYDGKRQMSRQIIDGVAEYVKLPAGCCLDVGCGSGALAIAVAKRIPLPSVRSSVRKTPRRKALLRGPISHREMP